MLLLSAASSPESQSICFIFLPLQRHEGSCAAVRDAVLTLTPRGCDARLGESLGILTLLHVELNLQTMRC